MTPIGDSILSAARAGGTLAQLPTGLITLRAMPGRIVQLLQQHTEARQHIAVAPRLSTRATADQNVEAEQAIARELEQLRTTDLQTITRMRSESEEARLAAESNITAQLEGAKVDAVERIAAWQRWKPILDQSSPEALDHAVKELARQALAGGDNETLAALRKELPAYVRSRVASQQLADEIRPIIVRALDDEIAAARPDVFAVVQLQREVDTGMPRLLAGFGQAEFAIQRGELAGVVIPSWDPKQSDHVMTSQPVNQRT